MEYPRKIHTNICNANPRNTTRPEEQNRQLCTKMYAASNTTNMVYKKNATETKNTQTPEQQHKTIRTSEVYLRTQQPTITSWIEKQGAIQMVKQTNPARKVHSDTHPRMKQIQERWEKTWHQIKQTQENSTQDGKTQEKTTTSIYKK